MDLYYIPESMPCRAVILTANHLGITLNKKLINLKAGDQLKPEYLKLNPQHTVPVLVDNGWALAESRAIMTYLAEKYGKDDSFYPKCPQKRALVNQRLFFDMDLSATRGAYVYPIYKEKKPADPEALKRLEDKIAFLNTFLEGQTYVTGDTLTVADVALATNVSTMEAIGMDLKKWPNVAKWYEHCKATLKGFDENLEGCQKWLKYW